MSQIKRTDTADPELLLKEIKEKLTGHQKEKWIEAVNSCLNEIQGWPIVLEASLPPRDMSVAKQRKNFDFPVEVITDIQCCQKVFECNSETETIARAAHIITQLDKKGCIRYEEQIVIT